MANNCFMESSNYHILIPNTAPVLIFFSLSKPTIMNSNLILKSDVLDIVFENRNKAYGAYDLRKYYPGRIKIAIGFMFIISIAFSAFTLLLKKESVHVSKPYVIEGPEFAKPPVEPKIPEKKTAIKKPEALPAADSKPVKEQQHISTIAIVDNTEKTEAIQTLVADSKISNRTDLTPQSAPPVIMPVKTETGSGNAAVESSPKIDRSIPMDGDAVEVLPSYPGGVEALLKFLKKNLENPAEKDEIVNVRIKFVVSYTGKLQSFVTVMDGGDAYNKEVIRVLKKMPDWIPGKTKGENVSVYYTIPVKFVPAD